MLTTWGGMAGIGLGHLLGESMIHLSSVEWRLLACLNGVSGDWIVVVWEAVRCVCMCTTHPHPSPELS